MAVSNKLASLGGSGGETEFEQAFSSLAYAYLRDKAPRLLDYMLGFQLVDRNEDNTKAVGVFGFQLDSQWLYAPVFFLNGDLKGHELLYMKNNDSFVPLKENWINYIMSRKPHMLGEKSEHSLRDLGGLHPDIRSLSVPPSVSSSKRGADRDWVQGIMPLIAAFKMKSANSLYPGTGARKLDQDVIVADPFAAALAKQADSFNLNYVLPQSFELIKAAYAVSETYPGVKRGMQRFYGVDCFSRWSRELRGYMSKQAGSIVPHEKTMPQPYMPGNLLLPLEPIKPREDHVKSGKLRLYSSTFIISQGATDLDEAERARLLNDTTLIKDHREGEEVSRAYNTQVEAKLVNPNETALYRVFEQSGKFSKMLVCVHGSSNRGREPLVTVVRLDGGKSNKAWRNERVSDVFTDQVSEREEWAEWFEGLPATSSLTVGTEYIGVGPGGASTVPFTVRKRNGDGQYLVEFKAGLSYPRKDPIPVRSSIFLEISTDDALLCIAKDDKSGMQLRALAGRLLVPATFKFILLRKAVHSYSGSLMDRYMDQKEESEDSALQLGGIDDIQVAFLEKTARLEVFNNGTDVYLNSVLGHTRMSKQAAVWDLMSLHGLGEKTAREILTCAERRGNAVYRIAYADGYGTEKKAGPNFSSLAGGPSAPVYDDLVGSRGVEQYGPNMSVNTQYGEEGTYPVSEMSAQGTSPDVWDPWQNYEAGDFRQNAQMAQQAGVKGQKEVFDTAMLSGLLKSVRQDSLVDKHLAALMSALDALGRMLFNFYWHGEEFEDRYGKSDMPELEDSLRNAFESLGDVTLFLKEKTIESPFDKGDISLDETARN